MRDNNEGPSGFRLEIMLQTRWQLSLRDAMIVAASQTSGGREPRTEDLNHGQTFGGMLVVNPFFKLLVTCLPSLFFAPPVVRTHL